MVGLFTQGADGFDKLVSEDEAFLDRWGTGAAGDYLHEGGFVNGLNLTAAATTFAGFKFSSTVAKGFVDVFRIGDGIQQGGWGYGRDALRALVVVGPALRAVRYAAGLVAAVDFDAGLGNCTWVAGARAMRFTGKNLFASVADLAKLAGLAAKETAGIYPQELATTLRLLGANVRTIAPAAKAELTTMEEVLKAATANRDGVLMFSVRFMHNGAEVGHTLLARWGLTGVQIIDRGNKVVKSLSELEKFYSGISAATPYGAGLFVETATTVKALRTVPSLLNTLALPVKPTVTWQTQLTGTAGSSTTRTSTTPTSTAPSLTAPKAGAAKPAAKPRVKLGSFKPHTTCIAPNSDQLPACTTFYTYTIGQGESLWKIAARAYGDATKWPIIYDANQGTIGDNPNLIQAGSELLIPSK